ncbi:hypothetical protein LXA43DRAFT_969231 [Ganoderma leucocontextum]|nr:hypothetical protein LXA43DRAFT_969231 [Ganoderma leucocontextum]
MSSALRTLSKHARSLSAPSHARAFHSPFAMLTKSESPLTKTPAPTSTAAGIYERNIQYDAEPFVSGAGHRTYVVSTPDPANTPYEVPSGAYPTSAPYQNYTRTEAPVPSGAQFASTSTGFAHPLTNRVPRNESGVRESAAIRFRDAPGEMHARGGSYGGKGLADPAGTQKGPGGELPDVNLPPLFENAERFSKAGVDNAWKERK